MKFKAHLHNHTDFSFKDSTANVSKSLQKAEELGIKGYAITDHGSIAGWVAADMASKKLNIKVIFGVEMYEAHERVGDKFGDNYHSVFLAKNPAGLKAIRALNTFSLKLENKFYNPRYDIDYLKAHKEMFHGNVIWMSGCLSGRVPKLIERNRKDEAIAYVKTMEEIFGKENVFVEIQNHQIHRQMTVVKEIAQMARGNGFNLVATNDVHYVNKEEYIAREIMLAREKGKTLEERRNNGDIYPAELYIKSPDEMERLFKSIPEALYNTGVIFDMVEKMSLEGEDWHFPNFPIPDGYTDETYMAKMVWDDLERKYPSEDMSEEDKEVLFERVKSEIDVIALTKACAYMLIDADYKKFAKEKGIRVGPGRGSACGSVVADVMDITNVNPLKYGLLMERFINPERVTMPDIDSDYEDERRMEVIEYVVGKYGADKVAQIMTIGTMGPKVSIRDTGAVLDLEPTLIDQVAKMIPMVPGMTIDKALVENPQLKELYERDYTVKDLIDHAKMVEGVARQSGVHAAGVIIADKPLVNYGALMESEDSDIPVFVGDMKAVEYLKLLKMDFLGLKTLSVIGESVKIIENNHGVIIDTDKIDMNDPEVYKFISSGATEGVFQLESGGMQDLMKNLQPTSLEDIIAGISMYRPGPMEKIPLFLENKRNPHKINYPEDAKQFLKPILDVTYGVMVYQEEVMQIVRDLAGYSFGRSDLVRRGMAKKKMSILQKERAVFIFGEEECGHCNGKGLVDGLKCPVCNGDKALPRKIACPHCEVDQESGKNVGCDKCDHIGYVPAKTNGVETVKGCEKNGISFETADSIFDDMIEFAKYAFNKSHATAYAIIAYQTAYLKYYYPVEYMTAYLNSLMDNRDKLKHFIGVARKMGLKLLKPDVNVSETKFTTDGKSIFMGLTALENVGKSITAMVEERKKNGEFKDIYDFIKRAPISKSELEGLTKSGALDKFEINRSQILYNPKKLIDYAKKDRAIKNSDQISFFTMKEFEEESGFQFEFPDIKEFPEMKLLSMERDVSGFYLTKHPLELDEYKDAVSESTITSVDEFKEHHHRNKVTMVGVISYDEKKEGIRFSKSGNRYGNFNLEDQYSSIKVMLFKEKVDKFEHLVRNGAVVKVNGSLMVEVREYENPENGEIIETTSVKIFADKIEEVNASVQSKKKVYIRINNKTLPLMNKIKETLNRYPGSDDVIIFNEDINKAMKGLKAGYSDALLKAMKEIVKENDIAVR